MTDLSRLPDWPARMKAPAAADYMGVSESAFHARVREGRYPQPVRDGGNTLWRRASLDDWLARERGEVLDTHVRKSWGNRGRGQSVQLPGGPPDKSLKYGDPDRIRTCDLLIRNHRETPCLSMALSRNKRPDWSLHINDLQAKCTTEWRTA